MKFYLGFLVLIFSIANIQADLLDGLEHHDHPHHDHDDHLDHHDDHLGHHDDHLDHHEEQIDHLEETLDNHFDDHDDHFDDQNDHQSDFGKQLLEEIEKFLPEIDSHSFVDPPNHELTNFNFEADNQFGGVPLVPQVNPITNNQIPQFEVQPPKPQATTFEQPQPFGLTPEQPQSFGFTPEQPQSFGITPEQPQSFGITPEQPNQSFTKTQQQEIPTNLLISRPTSTEDYDTFDDSSIYDVDISDSLSSAPFYVDSAHEDYEDIQNNQIGGQGRQLNAENSFPQAPNSFSLLDGEYPRHSFVPLTGFSCGDHQNGGYYADTEAECQVFHICLDGSLMGSFLCPNGTLFNQALFVCDWWFNVDCSVAPQSYHLNARIGVVPRRDEDFS